MIVAVLWQASILFYALLRIFRLPHCWRIVGKNMTLDIAQVATDSLHEIAEQGRCCVQSHHAELVDDSEAMDYSGYAPQSAKVTETINVDEPAARPKWRKKRKNY